MTRTASSGSSVTVAAATANVEVLQSRRGRRLDANISNVGANAAFLIISDVQNATAADTGIYLAPGSTWNSNERLPEQERITCYSTGGTTLAVFERVML